MDPRISYYVHCTQITPHPPASHPLTSPPSRQMCARNRYSEREWQHLVRQDEWEWPEDWGPLSTDLAYWEPWVREICRRHGLPADREIRLAGGRNTAFLTGDIVIKV